MKKSLLQIITLALVVVNLVLSALLIFTCMPAISKTSNLVDKICEIVDLDVKGSADENTTVDITKLEEVAVTFNGETTASLNLKTGDDGNHVLVFVHRQSKLFLKLCLVDCFFGLEVFGIICSADCLISFRIENVVVNTVENTSQ